MVKETRKQFFVLYEKYITYRIVKQDERNRH